MKLLTLLITLFLSMTVNCFSKDIKINHVEPMFWWAGMNNPELQILVHASDIASTQVSFTYPGVSLKNISILDNPNYLFINLLLDESVEPGSFEIKFKKRSKLVASYTYELKKRDENSANRVGFNSSDVMYLIMPDRFSNGNYENDSTADTFEKVNREDVNGRHGGDIQGIINHLDYLQDLGVTAIWNTPLMEDNQPTISYHQYAITDYYKIDSRFGTNEDYKRLSAECKKRGIKLVMDMVNNHCGTEHYWIKDLPSKDWIHQWAEYTNSNHRKTTTNDPYVSAIDSKINHDGWFDHSMADLNQKNTFLTKYFTQNTIWWIEYADLHGIRQDTYPYNDKDGMAYWAKGILTEYPNMNIVGEGWMPMTSDIAYWQKDVNNKDGYNSYLPTVMDFPLTDAMTLAFNEESNWNTGLIRLYNSLSRDYLYANTDNLLVFVDNHDTSRLFDIVNQDPKAHKLALAFMLTTRGIPQLYSGAEVLMKGKKSDGDGVMRIDFPGGWEGDEINLFTQEGRNAEQNNTFDFLRTLLNFRKDNSVLHTGRLLHYIPENDIYVYFRINEEKTMMIVLNNNNKEKQTIDLSRFSEGIAEFKGAKNILNDSLVDFSEGSITIDAKTPMVFELR